MWLTFTVAKVEKVGSRSEIIVTDSDRLELKKFCRS
jgi:hypothetical protein